VKTSTTEQAVEAPSFREATFAASVWELRQKLGQKANSRSGFASTVSTGWCVGGRCWKLPGSGTAQRRGTGVDGVSIENCLDPGKEAEFLDRSKGVCRNGPIAPRRCGGSYILKPNGKLRRWAFPTVRDRVVRGSGVADTGANLRQTLRIASHGFRPGRSATTRCASIQAP